LNKKLRPAISKKTKPFTSLDDLPLNLNVADISNVLGLSMSKTYQFVKELPRLQIGGRRVIVPKAEFIKWYESNIKTT
jgi:predicted DNA-binding transcriptional regulator AlpA